jgi:hypothetical protein
LQLPSSFEIAVYDLDEIIGCLGTRTADSRSGCRQMFADMILDDFGKQTVDGTTASGEKPHDLGALGLRLQSPLHCLNLPAQLARTVDELGLFADCVAHEYPYTLPG